MDSPGGLALYAGVKLLAYAAWCWFGLARAGAPSTGRLPRALAMGFWRWVLGLVLGVLVFFLVPAQRDQVVALYVVIYVPLRLFEWGLLCRWLLPQGVHWPERLRVGWVAGGILLSFLTDLTSPQMIEHGRFCVGRCLC